MNTPLVSDSFLSRFEKVMEKVTGESIETLRNETIDARRRRIEKETGRTTKFYSAFPYIGRGNVLRDRCVSRQEIDQQLDRALRKI